MAAAAAAAEELPFDLFEEILKRLDVEDLLKCKSVCKSWKSFISNPCFVKAHMEHSYNNDRRNRHPNFMHRRINYVNTTKQGLKRVVGSCNGLVCFSSSSSSTNVDDEFVLVNPSTKEVNKTTTPFRHLLDKCKLVCQGFGYDSSADDYKIIAGFTSEEEKQRILFYALTLKSNVWKLIGELKYHRCANFCETGTFYGGALHWFMYENKRIKIMSLDLSTEEFKEIPQPPHEDYAPGYMKHQCYYEEQRLCEHILGVLEEGLSIYKICCTSRSRIWVMNNNNKWEPHGDCYFRTNDGQHYLHELDGYTLNSNGIRFKTCSVISDSIIVKSLVSPHPCVNNNDNYYEGQTMGIAKTGKKNKKRNKRRKRSCKRKTVFNKLLTWMSSSIFVSNRRFVLIPRSLDPMSKILIFMFVCLRFTLGYTFI